MSCRRSVGLLILFLAVPAWSATPTINGTPVSGIATTSNTVTLSVTVAAGSNRLALITLSAVSVGAGSAVGVGASVVFNGSENAVFIGGSYGPGYIATEQWYLKMPTVTTANFVGTWDPDEVATNSFTAISVIVLDGVEQSGTPHRTQTCQEDLVGTTQPDLAVEASTGDLSVDSIVTWLDAITDPDAGQTEQTDDTATLVSDTIGFNSSTETATDSSTEMGWTKSGTDNYHQYCGVSIKGVGSGRGLTLLGVGR